MVLKVAASAFQTVLDDNLWSGARAVSMIVRRTEYGVWTPHNVE